MEAATPFLGASLALAAGMLGYLHHARRLHARDERDLAETERRLGRAALRLEQSGHHLHKLKGSIHTLAEASFAEARLNEAIAELALLHEKKKRAAVVRR
jgi:hypothetical protein